MNTDSPRPDERGFDSILASLIEAQERAKDQPVDVSVWTEKYPHYAAQIQSFFANRGKLEEVLGPRAVVDSEAPTIGGKADAGEGQRVRYFGDYELLSEIARGGMGVVFKARQVSLNRVVAVKMILSGNLAGLSDVQRFHAEAEAAAHLDHPHIVPIYEVGEHEGQHYFSMKLIEGSSLSSAKNDSHGSSKEKQRWAASLVAQVARAVHHAHQRGILHRDLKPGNVLLDQHGEPHVTDFGLAKKVEGGSDLTNTGAIVGTPAYMAPEQARCEKGLSTAVDVYSLGAILYELLTGRPPFKADSPLDTILEVLEKEPTRPSTIVQTVDRDLETITLKCLEKEPGRRFGSAEALAEELGRWERGEPITIRPVGQWERGWRWCRRNRALAGSLFGAAAALLIGTGLALWQAHLASIEADRAGKEKQKAERMLALQANREGLRLIDSGDWFTGLLWFTQPLVVAAGQLEVEQITRDRLGAYRHLEGKRFVCSQMMAYQGNITQASFSPDGRRVVTASGDRTARVWDAVTGQPVTPPMEHEASVKHAAFSPDGRRVVTASNGKTARVWDAVTGQPVIPPMKYEDTVQHMAYSPDGRHVVTASKDKTARVWNAINGQPVTPPMKHEGQVNHAAFSPDGRCVVTASKDNIARVWDAVTGQPVTLAMKHDNYVQHAAFSPDGLRVVTASKDETARVWDAVTGQPVAPPMKHERSVEHAAFSPDGCRVVTASGDQTARVWNAVTGQPVAPPMKHDSYVQHAEFSPDGHRVVTASWDKTVRVWDAATSQPATPPMKHENLVYHASFSPDSRHVVTASMDYTARVWDAATGQPVTPPMKHENQVSHAAFSPDSRHVVTASMDYTARVWDAVTGQLVAPPMKHEGQVIHAAFSPDGCRVVTASGDNTARVWNAVTGQPVAPSMKHEGQVIYAAFSPDGCRVVTASRDKTTRVWDAVTGQLVAQPMKHEGVVRHAAFSPDGHRVVTASEDKTARVWDVPADDRLANDLLHLAQVYAGHKIDDMGSLQPLDVEKELLPWFHELKAKYPADFTVTPQQARAWRENEIAQCMKEGNLPAALFHQNWLLAEAVQEAAKLKR